MSTELAKRIVENYLKESGEILDEHKDFLSNDDMAFLEKNGFTLEEDIDPHVKRYHGLYLPNTIRQLLSKGLGVDNFIPLVWINFNDNSDFGCPNTYRVEIGVEGVRKLFGVFGKSSPFCSTIDSAYMEAAVHFLYVLSPVKGPGIVCYRRRLY